MSPAENIAYGLLQYIQLNEDNVYILLSLGEQVLNNNSSKSTAMYSEIFSDILATQSKEGTSNNYESLTLYRIKAYTAQFINIVNQVQLHATSKDEYTLRDIKALNTYIAIILKERFKLFGETKADRKYVNKLLDFICNGNNDLREILFKCIADDYVEF